MPRPASTHFLVCEEAPFFLKIRQRVVIHSIEVSAPTPLPRGEYCVWAATSAVPSRLSADLAYAAATPFVVGSVVVTHEDLAADTPSTLRVPVSRWELQAGTTLLLHVAARGADVHSVVAAMVGCRRRAYNWCDAPATRATQPPPPPPFLESTSDAELSPLVTVRLSGAADPNVFDDDAIEWSPFVVQRWFELADADLGEATLVFRPSAPPSVEGRSVVSADAADTYFSLFAGGVKEAAGVDPDGVYVKWLDGSIGLVDELRPYLRVFTPARPEKVSRVRRFPHRNADVVGELPHGTRAIAVGRQTDPFTGEDYALLVLPDDPALAHLPELYGLASLSPSQWLWGWSKIAGSGGAPLLRDVTAEAQAEPAGVSPLQLISPHSLYSSSVPTVGSPTASSRSTRVLLPSPTFYTTTRAEKSVRIRKKASLKSEIIGEVEPNEVKEAVREVAGSVSLAAQKMAISKRRDGRQHLPLAGGNTAAQPPTFVEWKSGGFSVLSNGKERFLRPVKLLPAPPFAEEEEEEGAASSAQGTPS